VLRDGGTKLREHAKGVCKRCSKIGDDRRKKTVQPLGGTDRPGKVGCIQGSTRVRGIVLRKKNRTHPKGKPKETFDGVARITLGGWDHPVKQGGDQG